MKKHDSLRTDTITGWPSIGHESAVVYRCTFFKTFTAVSEHGQTVFISVPDVGMWPAQNGRTKVTAEKERLLVRIDRDQYTTDFVVAIVLSSTDWTPKSFWFWLGFTRKNRYTEYHSIRTKRCRKIFVCCRLKHYTTTEVSYVSTARTGADPGPGAF